MYSTIFQSFDHFLNFIKTFKVTLSRLKGFHVVGLSGQVTSSTAESKVIAEDDEMWNQLSVMSSPKAGNFGSFTLKALMWLQILILGGVPKWDLMDCTISSLSFKKKNRWTLVHILCNTMFVQFYLVDKILLIKSD